MHDRRSDRFSIPVFGVEPADYADIKDWNVAELERERVRLWYVAATRARDLLILPRHSSVLNERAFAKIVDFDLPSLVTIDPEALGDPMPTPPAPPENRQTRDLFAEEAGDIVRSHRKIEWRQPSRSEAVAPAEVERRAHFRQHGIGRGDSRTTGHHGRRRRDERNHPAQAHGRGAERRNRGRPRSARRPRLGAHGAIVHYAVRSSSATESPPHELAQTIVRTLNIPEIAQLRPRLVPEHTIYGSQVNDDSEIIVSGIADAVAYDAEGRIEIIVDWKSDVDIDVSTLNSYRGQLDTYRRFTGATRALLVLVTKGKVIEL